MRPLGCQPAVQSVRLRCSSTPAQPPFVSRVSCLVSRAFPYGVQVAGAAKSASGALLDPGTVFCTVSCTRACIRMRSGPWTRLRDVPDYILDPRPKQGCDSRPESPHQGHARGRPGTAQESVLVTRTQMSGLSRLPRRNHARTKAIAQKNRHPAEVMRPNAEYLFDIGAGKRLYSVARCED